MPGQSTGRSKARRWPAKYSVSWASAASRCAPAAPDGSPGRPPAGPGRNGGGPKPTLASPAALQATEMSPTGDASAPQASSPTATLLTPTLSPPAPTVPGTAVITESCRRHDRDDSVIVNTAWRARAGLLAVLLGEPHEGLADRLRGQP